jgi:hypothetical protein
MFKKVPLDESYYTKLLNRVVLLCPRIGTVLA